MLPSPERDSYLARLTPTTKEAAQLEYDWSFWGRPSQHPPPGEWRVWLVLAGRGWGKTRTGAELVRQWVRKFALVNVIGATSDDARDIMVNGRSGLLHVCGPDERPVYKPAQRLLEWPNGAQTYIFTADEPDRLRGKQHEKIWADEVAAWRYPEAWDQAMFGLRLGSDPQVVATTTPKPTPLVRGLLVQPGTVVTRGASFENRANLAPTFFADIVGRYQGTRLGRQELYAEILTDNPAALWQREAIHADRVLKAPALERIVVGVDPEATSGEDSAETGIIVAAKGTDGHGYVLDDRSLRATPLRWASAAVTAYHQHAANLLVAETNQGGEMVQQTVRGVDPNVAYKGVHASHSKQARAEPVAALYEQHRVHHVGTFGELEDQLTSWVPGAGPSPDRLDALVWALTELLVSPREVQFF